MIDFAICFPVFWVFPEQNCSQINPQIFIVGTYLLSKYNSNLIQFDKKYGCEIILQPL